MFHAAAQRISLRSLRGLPFCVRCEKIVAIAA